MAAWAPRLARHGDGFGRSETREVLRDFFEVDAKHIALAALHALALDGELPAGVPKQAIEELGIDPEKVNPRLV